MREREELWAASERWVAGRGPGERRPGDDRYGGGAIPERVERRVAELLGTEAAVWMPSGTMAQQIALRIHADRVGSRSVAFHPLCHLDTHEERGYAWLHGLHAVHLGDRDRLVTAGDVAGLRERVAAVLLELPQRDLGGALPGWDELTATVEAARARGARLHLDGARLWQCGPFYERPIAEIAALFDTVYVSFYKDLLAPGGCALAGPADVIGEARVWLVRHGGRVFETAPYLLAAERGLDEVLPRMPEYVAHARALGAALAAVDGIDVAPDPPQAAMLHLHVRGTAGELNERVLALAERTGTWLGAWFRPSANPQVAVAELGFGAESLAVPPAEAAALYAELAG